MIELANMIEISDLRLAHYADLSEVDGKIGDVSMLIIGYDALIAFLATWYFVNTKFEKKIFAIMTVVASFWDMLFFGMGSLMRVGYFFSIVNIAVLPDLASMIENKWGKKVAFLFVIICVSYAIKTTLPSFTSIDPNLFGNYKFIFLK